VISEGQRKKSLIFAEDDDGFCSRDRRSSKRHIHWIAPRYHPSFRFFFVVTERKIGPFTDAQVVDRKKGLR
jgi:hypothetical protein